MRTTKSLTRGLYCSRGHCVADAVAVERVAGGYFQQRRSAAVHVGSGDVEDGC